MKTTTGWAIVNKEYKSINGIFSRTYNDCSLALYRTRSEARFHLKHMCDKEEYTIKHVAIIPVDTTKKRRAR
jgi:hypothetical protein